MLVVRRVEKPWGANTAKGAVKCVLVRTDCKTAWALLGKGKQKKKETKALQGSNDGGVKFGGWK
ncbi:hypothetical protein PG995_002343 [Apiospora arundinis]